MKRTLILFAAVSLTILSCTNAQTKNAKFPDPPETKHDADFPMKLSDAEWRKRLNALQFNVLREEGTEAAGSGRVTTDCRVIR